MLIKRSEARAGKQRLAAAYAGLSSGGLDRRAFLKRAGVTGFASGDRVVAFTGIGAFAEKVAVGASQVYRLPDRLDTSIAAAMLITYGTSYHALKDRAALQPGETLLVLGAAGGVGLAAVELGKRMGARVIAAASSADKLELARSRGADELIDYAGSDLREQIRA